MKQYSFLLFITLTISILFGCSKEDNPYEGKIHVEGQVLEKGKIPKPIPNAMVILSEVKVTGVFDPVYYIPLDTVLSDKDGNYVLERSANGLSGAYHIYAFADPEQYWNRSDEPVIGKNIRKGVSVNNTLFIQPYGFVKVNIKNVNPVDDDDYFIINVGTPKGKTFLGKQVDDTYFARENGNDTITVYHDVLKTGQQYAAHKTKYFLNSHDTLKLNINY